MLGDGSFLEPLRAEILQLPNLFSLMKRYVTLHIRCVIQCGSWFCIYFGDLYSQGVCITTCIGQKELNKFVGTVKEGHSYFIKNFQVSKQARKYNAVPSTYTLYFTSWTTIQEVPAELLGDLPLYNF